MDGGDGRTISSDTQIITWDFQEPRQARYSLALKQGYQALRRGSQTLLVSRAGRYPVNRADLLGADHALCTVHGHARAR